MDFGKVKDPSLVDFKLPKDASQTKQILLEHKGKEFEVYIGCAKWNKEDLKEFYPKGTKDELTYYSKQFNSIELNATFYNVPSSKQIEVWRDKTPENFKFFPKLSNTISHEKRLNDVKQNVAEFCKVISNFKEKLGMVFLQLHENFEPKDFDKLEKVIEEFPKGIPLGIEVRNKEWFSNLEIQNKFCELLEKYDVANIIVDTAGRRDMLHMRLTNSVAFIRYVSANHESDMARLDEWITRIEKWRAEGLQKLYFFVHQNNEIESPLLATHFIEQINKVFKLKVTVPEKKLPPKDLFSMD